MDFTKDIAGQRKRSREESNELTFSVYRTKPDLTLLKAAYGLLSSKEKYDLEVQFGRIVDLFSIVPDWKLFKAMLKFYVPEYGAFVFPQFELVLTIDEYHQFLRCSTTVDSDTFTPKQQHMKLTSVMVQEMLQRICGFSFDFTQPLLKTSWDTDGFNWDAAFTTMGKSLADMRSSERIRFVALGVYGMVIFPIYVKSIAPMVVALFDQLLSTSAFNPAPTVVAETLRSLQDIRVKRKGRFLGCIELFTAWAHDHLVGPRFETLLSVPIKERKVEDWHRIFLSASISDVRFVLSSWSATCYLHPPEGHHFIPLLGIRGGISYSVELAHRQFGEAQGVPYLNDGLPPPFDYPSPTEITKITEIVGKISEAHELWVKCRMLPIWKESGTRPEYGQWRSIWMKTLPLSLEVINTKESTIRDLTTKLELSHAQRAQLQEKYDGLAFEHELLKRGKELSDQQVKKLKDKVTLLEANKQVCVEQKKTLKFGSEQKERLLQMKADLKAKEEENKELVEKMAKQQKLEEEVAQWKNDYNNLLSNYSALEKELQVVKQSKQGGEENTS